LNLTILLSSHLLNEVEQLCTRIAVMNRGRKVFEGTIADATRRPDRVRLLTDDFPAAAHGLAEAGLADATEATARLTLRPGVRTADVARWLVQHSHPIHELAIEEQTLENFYLSLMEESRATPAALPLR
jgi:ABC-2 type transport system ATP-binding protein